MNIVTKATGDSLTANEFNQIPDELENLITSAGISPSDLDLTQVAKTVAQYSADGNFYNATGTANAIVLDVISPRIAPVSLTNGFKARFKAFADNTGNVTINIANLGAKNIYYNGNALQAGEIETGKYYEVEYNSTADNFILTKEVYNNVKYFDTLSSLIADTTVKSGDFCITSGYYTANDGGKGLYIIRPQDVSDVDNGGTIVFIQNSLVAELVITNNIINAKQFGAKGDNATDDTTTLQNAIDYITANGNKETLFIPSGTYLTSLPLCIYTNNKIIGENCSSTKIKKTTNTVGTSSSVNMNGHTDVYNVDSILSFIHSNNAYTDNVHLENLSIICDNSVYCKYAIYAPRMSQSFLKNLKTNYTEFGFYSFNSWLCQFNGIGINNCGCGFIMADDGVTSGAGTNLILENCYVNTCNCGYQFYGISGVTMNCCAVDHLVYKDLTGLGYVNYAMLFRETKAVVNGCTVEGIGSGNAIWILGGQSYVTLNNCRFQYIDGSHSGSAVTCDSCLVIFNNCEIENFINGTTPYNMIIQHGAKVIKNNTHFPDNGNFYVSYNNNSVLTEIKNGVITNYTTGTTEVFDKKITNGVWNGSAITKQKSITISDTVNPTEVLRITPFYNITYFDIGIKITAFIERRTYPDIASIMMNILASCKNTGGTYTKAISNPVLGENAVQSGNMSSLPVWSINNNADGSFSIFVLPVAEIVLKMVFDVITYSESNIPFTIQ